MLSHTSSPVDYNYDSDSGSVCRGRKWLQTPEIVPVSDRCEHNCPFCTKASCERSMTGDEVQCLCNTCDDMCWKKQCSACCGTDGVVCQLCACCAGFHSLDGLVTANTADEFLAKSVAAKAKAPALDAAAQKLFATTLGQSLAKHLSKALGGSGSTAHVAGAGPAAAGPRH